MNGKRVKLCECSNLLPTVVVAFSCDFVVANLWKIYKKDTTYSLIVDYEDFHVSDPDENASNGYIAERSIGAIAQPCEDR